LGKELGGDKVIRLLGRNFRNRQPSLGKGPYLGRFPGILAVPVGYFKGGFLNSPN